MGTTMEKLTHALDKALSVFLMALMSLMVLTVTWQVVSRFILKAPSSYTEELARFLLIWIGLLGASYALRTKAHLGIDILPKYLSGSKQKLLLGFIYLLVMAFAFFVMVVGGFRLVDLTFTLDQTSAAMGIRMGYVYLVLPVSGVIMMFYSLVALLEIRKTGAV